MITALCTLSHSFTTSHLPIYGIRLRFQDWKTASKLRVVSSKCTRNISRAPWILFSLVARPSALLPSLPPPSSLSQHSPRRRRVPPRRAQDVGQHRRRDSGGYPRDLHGRHHLRGTIPPHLSPSGAISSTPRSTLMPPLFVATRPVDVLQARAQDLPELRRACAPRVLRQRHLPPHHQGLLSSFFCSGGPILSEPDAVAKSVDAVLVPV